MKRRSFNIHGGKYLTWKLSRHVNIQLTKKGGRNALVSGLFFDTK